MKTIIDGMENRRALLLLGIGLSLILGGVHAYVVNQGGAYKGTFLILDHLFDLGLIVGLLTLCAAVGLRLLNPFRFPVDQPLEALLFSIAIGCGAVAVSILVLGFLFSLRTITFAGIVALWMLVARNQFLQTFCLISQAATNFKVQSNRLSLVFLAVIAVFLVSQAVLPPRDWDSLMYHLRVPAQFLERSRFFVPEDNFHVAYIQLIHMLYLPLLDVGSSAGPAVLSASFALLLGLAVFTFAHRFYQEPTASLSLILLWASTMLSLVAITARVDVTLAYFLLLAHFALFLAWTDWRFYYLAAVLLGLAFGVKYNALLYVIALSPLIVYVAVCKAPDIGISAIISQLVSFGLIFSCAGLPWLVKNWLLLGAPVYPFFAQTKINSWLSFVYPNQVYLQSVDPKILTMLAEVRSPLNLWDLFLNPGALTVEHEALAYHLNPLFLCLAFWFISPSKTRTIEWLLIPPLGYLGLLFLFSATTNLRYIIPAIAPLTIVAVHLTVLQLTRVVGAKRLMVAMYFLALVVLWPMAQTLGLWTVNKTTLAYLGGTTSREDFLSSNVFPPDYYPAAQVVTYANQHLNSTNRILMLFEARGLYFNIPVIQDNMLTNWPLLSTKLESIGCLEDSGISHVLVNGGALSFYFERGLSRNVVRWKKFQQFSDRCLFPIYQGVGHILYEVRHGKANSTS